MRAKLFILAFLVLLLPLILSPASAQTTPAAATDPIPVGQIGGATNVMVFSGGNLYFNVGPRIVRAAVSASTPLTPTLPAVYGNILPGIPEDIKVANGYVYVAMGSAGVAIVDATTLQSVAVQSLPVISPATAVAVGSQRLYVAAGYDGIIAYDLGTGHNTLTYAQTKTFTSPARNVTDVEVRLIPVVGGTGEFLFVSANNFAAVPANRGGVLKFDITTSPVLGIPADVKEQIDVNSLAVTNAFVYAAGDDVFYSLDTTELGTTGISGTLALTTPAEQVSLGPSGSTAYLANGTGGIDVVDVSTPTAPVMLTGSSFFTNGVVSDLAAVEFGGSPTTTYLYLADRGAGLSIASSPHATPQNLTLDRPSYLLPKPAIAGVVAGTYPQAFVANSNSTDLWTVDTSNLDSLGIVGASIAPSTTINAMTTYSDSLLVSNSDGLHRYDINSGTEPTFVDEVATGGVAYEVAASWPIAVVANSTSGLAVVDISDTLTMTVIGSAPAPVFNSDFRTVDVQEDFAYVGDLGGNPNDNTTGTFRVYDLSDPTAPVARGVLSETGILDVKVAGNLAFLALGSHGIEVADVSNPDAPVIIDTDDYTGTVDAENLAIFKNFLFVADDSGGVQMLRFQPTGQLSLVTAVQTSGHALQLAWVPGYLYVADEDAGLFVIQIGADVALTNTAPATAYAGQNFTYTLKVDNVGATVANGFVITDELPANVTFVTAQNCINAASTITCTVPSLAVGANTTFAVVVKSDVTGVYTNTASVFGGNFDVDMSNNSSAATTTILAAADLSVANTASPVIGTVYQPLTYTVVVRNLGPSPATNVVMTDTLSPKAQFVSATGGTCSGTSTVACNLGSLSASGVATVTVVVMPTASGPLSNTAVVTSDVFDAVVSNNSSDAAITVKYRILLPLLHR